MIKKILFIILFIPIFTYSAEISIFPDSQISKGETLTIFIKSDNNKIINSIEGTFINKKINFIKNNFGCYAFIGIPIKMEHGVYTIKTNIIYDDKTEEKIDKVYKILDFELKKIKITVSKQKIDPINKTVLNNEAEIINNTVTSIKINEPLFTNKFSLPVKDRMSAPFAVLYDINNGQHTFYHYGIDFASNIGTEIKASNTGVIVNIVDLLSYGKTVIVEHGAGIFTMYNHLSKTNLEIGKKINANDIVGYSGHTGISTGPHLHWQLFVNGICVNPLTWTQDTYFQNIKTLGI